MIQHPGNVFVVSAPSGAGKSTLAQRLVASVPDLVFSISFTTRKPRPGEVDGRDYFFIDGARFDAMVREGGFVEWVQVYGHRYGTGRDWLQQTLGVVVQLPQLFLPHQPAGGGEGSDLLIVQTDDTGLFGLFIRHDMVCFGTGGLCGLTGTAQGTAARH